MYHPARWILAGLLLTVAADAAQPIPTSRLDAWFNALDDRTLANCAVAITEQGEIRYERYVGIAATGPDGQPPIDNITRFRIGPVSQLFTAVLTLQLAEKGSITLDNRLAEFFPDIPNALEITYRDLLQQRSGLADYTAGAPTDKTPAEILERIAAAGPRFAPRSRVEYSASNYLLLGYMLEKVYDKPYAEVLSRQIADKIGLSRTGATDADAAKAIAAHQLTGLGTKMITWQPTPGLASQLHGGAASIVSTPVNLARFMDALFARRLISEHNLGSLYGQDGDPAQGLTPVTVGGETGYGIGGVIDGYWAAVYHFPGRKISVAIASSAPQLPFEDVLDETLQVLLDRKHQPRGFTVAPLPEKRLKPYLGRWRWSADAPPPSPFRRFSEPGKTRELRIVGTATGLALDAGSGAQVNLLALGGDDFRLDFGAADSSWYLKFSPLSGELVVRDYDRAYWFKRAE